MYTTASGVICSKMSREKVRTLTFKRFTSLRSWSRTASPLNSEDSICSYLYRTRRHKVDSRTVCNLDRCIDRRSKKREEQAAENITRTEMLSAKEPSVWCCRKKVSRVTTDPWHPWHRWYHSFREASHKMEEQFRFHGSEDWRTLTRNVLGCNCEQLCIQKMQSSTFEVPHYCYTCRNIFASLVL